MRIGRIVTVAVVAALSAMSVAGPGSSNTSASAPCQSPQLHLAATFYGEAGGQFIETFAFTNVSSRACRIAGWPRLRVEGRSHRVVAARVRRVVQGQLHAPPFVSVPLRPRGAASFDVYGPDWDFRANRSCPRTTAALVTPPENTDPLRVIVRMPNCPGGFEIAPLIAGRTDRLSWSFVWQP
jgi:Protein of unknown function (DUF4232)